MLTLPHIPERLKLLTPLWEPQILQMTSCYKSHIPSLTQDESSLKEVYLEIKSTPLSRLLYRLNPKIVHMGYVVDQKATGRFTPSTLALRS